MWCGGDQLTADLQQVQESRIKFWSHTRGQYNGMILLILRDQIKNSSSLCRINKWPGRSHAVENKVPTTLVYPKNSPYPSSWGFLSENPTEQFAEDKIYWEWFKTYLDEGRLRLAQERAARKDANIPVPRSMGEVEKWYQDYLTKLYEHIQFRLAASIGQVSWENARIEFIFSVPTTWEHNPTVERFRSIIQRSGFSRYPGHEIKIDLTEAEAAAVWTSKEISGNFRVFCSPI